MSLGGKTCLVVCFFLIPVPRPASHMLSAGSMCPWAVSSPAKIGPVLWKMEKVLWEEDCEMIGMTWGAFETPGRSTHVNYSPWLFLATSSSGFESGQLPQACSQLGTGPPQPVQASAAPWWPPGPLLNSVSKAPFLISGKLVNPNPEDRTLLSSRQKSWDFPLEPPLHSCPGPLLQYGARNS